MTTNKCHKLSRSQSCGKRPRSAPRQKLSKALSATSSSSAAQRGTPWSLVRANATKRRKYEFHSFSAAVGSPDWSWSSHWVTEPVEDIAALLPENSRALWRRVCVFADSHGEGPSQRMKRVEALYV